jgi:DNA-binding response OmpR family regulator
MPLKVLFIEDEVVLRDALCDLMNQEGFAATGVGSISSFIAWRKTHSCDVLVVDRKLPDGDGLEAIRKHRLSSDGPVVVLSAQGQSQDRSCALNEDADYYLTKPIDSDELIALLRRFERKSLDFSGSSWILDRERWSLLCPGKASVALNHNELLLLACFVEKAGITQEKSLIIRALGHDVASYDPRRLESMVSRLRSKVEAVAPDFPLTTIYGIGYSFNARLSSR